MPSIFTFDKQLVTQWLVEAKESCKNSYIQNPLTSAYMIVNGEQYYGGPAFIYDDLSTHWTESSQLYTWWKNNVERRNKFRVLQEDALYRGVDVRRACR